MAGNLTIEVLWSCSLIDGVEHPHRTQSLPWLGSKTSWDRKQQHSLSDPEQKCPFGSFLWSPEGQKGRCACGSSQTHETPMRFLFKSLTRHPEGLEREEKILFLPSRHSPSEQQIRTGSLKEVTKNIKGSGRDGGKFRGSAFLLLM